jgi:hypothetical protein
MAAPALLLIPSSGEGLGFVMLSPSAEFTLSEANGLRVNSGGSRSEASLIPMQQEGAELPLSMTAFYR